MCLKFFIFYTVNIIFLRSIGNISCVSYQISDGMIPTYLNYPFKNDEEIDHKNIIVNVSLSRLEGTLLYVIDRYHQLIVTLHEEPIERMKIEINGRDHFVTLSELCGCHQCRYKPLKLTFRTNAYIYVKCNELPNKYWELPVTKRVNEAYPTTDIKSGIWLVNTPAHGQYHPNNVQLSGCIFDVSYNGKPMDVSTYGQGVKEGCTKLCEKDICNAGQCYETYNIDPFCDCTNSFMNGPKCNSPGLYLSNHRITSVDQKIKFNSLKLSWRSNSSRIVMFENEAKELLVYIKNEKLIFKICVDPNKLESNITKKNCKQEITSTITSSYNKSANSTLIIEFEEELIHLKYTYENKSIISTFDVPWRLSEEHFTTMSFLNGNGLIDAVYKQKRYQYDWTKIELDKLTNKTSTLTFDKKKKRNNWKDRGYKFQLEQPITEKDKSYSYKDRGYKFQLEQLINEEEVLNVNNGKYVHIEKQQDKSYSSKVGALIGLSILAVGLVSVLIYLIRSGKQSPVTTRNLKEKPENVPLNSGDNPFENEDNKSIDRVNLPESSC